MLCVCHITGGTKTQSNANGRQTNANRGKQKPTEVKKSNRKNQTEVKTILNYTGNTILNLVDNEAVNMNKFKTL